MKIHKNIEGYVISCMISVPIKKLQGPKLKLNPIICTKINRYSMLLRSGEAH